MSLLTEEYICQDTTGSDTRLHRRLDGCMERERQTEVVKEMDGWMEGWKDRGWF